MYVEQEAVKAALRLKELINNFNDPGKLNDEQKDVLLVCDALLGLTILR